jgi:hypothetical protein
MDTIPGKNLLKFHTRAPKKHARNPTHLVELVTGHAQPLHSLGEPCLQDHKHIGQHDEVRGLKCGLHKHIQSLQPRAAISGRSQAEAGAVHEVRGLNCGSHKHIQSSQLGPVISAHSIFSAWASHFCKITGRLSS